MNRWSNWARQFRARHRRTARFASGLGFVFRLPAGPAAARVRFRRTIRHLTSLTSPRLSVSLVFQGPGGSTPRPAMPAKASLSFRSSVVHVREAAAPLEWRSPAAVTPPGRTAALREEQRTEFVRFVHHEAISRTVESSRGASGSAPVPTTPMAAGAHVVQARAWAARVRRSTAREEVLNRTPVAFTPARPSVPATPAPRAHEAEATTPFAGERPFAPPPPQQQPAMNVEALTDHVIKRIDQRLIAYRERMGRA